MHMTAPQLDAPCAGEIRVARSSCPNPCVLAVGVESLVKLAAPVVNHEKCLRSCMTWTFRA